MIKNFKTLDAAQNYAKRKGIGLMMIRVKQVGKNMVYMVKVEKHINKAW
jgi:hypothetical protein